MPNKPTVVRTNSTPNSVKVVQLKAVTFQELWDNYPSGNPYDNSAYENQCAIRMSVTFHRVGIGMKSFSSKLVRPSSGQSTIGRIILDGKPTATRADEMGQWLKLQPFAGLSKAEDVTGPDWQAKVKGRRGIIQFSRYWTREGESTDSASGGHIDLWNGDTLTASGIGGRLTSFLRFRVGVSSLWYSDLGKSKQILFLGDQVRRFALLALLGVSGCTTGIAVTAVLLAFVPRCGYDCENYSFGIAFLSVVGCTLAFLLIGYAFTRGARLTAARTLTVSGIMAAVAIFAASGRYVYELHAHYQQAQAARPVVADFDFMYMAIATRDVQTYTNAEEGATKAASVIPQWQRCVIDGASCDGRNRQAHMRCKEGAVYVNESDWNAFSLIPQENLPGAVAMKSMNLCAPDNVPDA